MAGQQEETVFDSPTSWVAEHVKRYLDTGGESGHEWRGFPTLLLTTRGRKSGKLRRTALIYGRDGDRYVVVASKGGAPKHPQWYLNLTAHPDVQIQVGAERFKGRARPANAEEKPALWEHMVSVYPPYESYQQKTSRDIPVVIIERV